MTCQLSWPQFTLRPSLSRSNSADYLYQSLSVSRAVRDRRAVAASSRSNVTRVVLITCRDQVIVISIVLL
ncbi:hypothetical protein J6590_053264 [Homalodisca vitripennis]|nr:hypothetical protein J6590_053264 [Homalodisca vitripennis]